MKKLVPERKNNRIKQKIRPVPERKIKKKRKNLKQEAEKLKHNLDRIGRTEEATILSDDRIRTMIYLYPMRIDRRYRNILNT